MRRARSTPASPAAVAKPARSECPEKRSGRSRPASRAAWPTRRETARSLSLCGRQAAGLAHPHEQRRLGGRLRRQPVEIRTLVAHEEPVLEGHDGAQGGVCVVGTDGDLLAGAALVGLGAPHQHAQAAAGDGRHVAEAECDELGAAQGGGEAQQQQGAVAQAERAGRGRAGGEHLAQGGGHGGGGLSAGPGAAAAHDALDDHGEAGVGGVERQAGEPVCGEDGGEVDAQAGDGEAAVGAVHGVHGEQPGLAGQGWAAEACAPGLPGAPGGAVGAQGAGAAGAGGVAGGALVQVLQDAGERAGAVRCETGRPGWPLRDPGPAAVAGQGRDVRLPVPRRRGRAAVVSSVSSVSFVSMPGVVAARHCVRKVD